MSEHDLTIASMGHAQHGKSSVLGCIALHFRGEKNLNHLLKAVEEKVRELSTPELRYSLLFDLPKNDFLLKEAGLKTGDESKTQSRLPGWVGCRLGGRQAMLVDEPGHPQFLKYMVAPSSYADIGILVVDARVFCEEHTRSEAELGKGCFTRVVDTKAGQIPYFLKRARDGHRTLATSVTKHKKASSVQTKYWIPQVCLELINYLAMSEVFGINHVIIAIHQLDRAGFSQDVFEDAKRRLIEMTAFLARHVSLDFIPTAVLAQQRTNHNVTKRSSLMPWYSGPTIAERLLDLAAGDRTKRSADGPFRMQLERIALGSKHLSHSPPPRVFGKIESGILKAGEEVILTPSGIGARVKTMRFRDESKFFSGDPYWDDDSWDVKECRAGAYVSIALTGKEFNTALRSGKRRMHWQGQIMSHPTDVPPCSDRFLARLQIVPPWWIEEHLNGLSLIYGYERVCCSIPWIPGNQEEWWENMTVEVVCERPIAMDVFRSGGGLGKIILECDGFFIAGGTVIEVLPRAQDRQP